MRYVYNMLINSRYRVLEEIGHGSYCRVNLGIDEETHEKVAIKEEIDKEPTSKLAFEAQVMREIRGDLFPSIHWSGKHNGKYTVVMDLLGISLGDVMKDFKGALPIDTVIQIAYKLIEILENLHDKGYVHRDLKPENILLGRKPTDNPIYLIDYGLSRRYKNSQTGQHSLYREGVGFKGNLVFASKYSLVGVTPSRRDDLESLSYLLIYLCKAELPWFQSKLIPSSTLINIRLNTNPQVFMKEVPKVMYDLLMYSLNLNFTEKPNYQRIRADFETFAKYHGFELDLPRNWAEPHPELQRRSTIEPVKNRPKLKDTQKAQSENKLLKNPSHVRGVLLDIPKPKRRSISDEYDHTSNPTLTTILEESSVMRSCEIPSLNDASPQAPRSRRRKSTLKNNGPVIGIAMREKLELLHHK
jgi:serine/threonine protein kinase